jgi:hypothetical protein
MEPVESWAMDWVFARLRVPVMQDNETLIGYEPVTHRRASGWWEMEHSGRAVWPKRAQESDGHTAANKPASDANSNFESTQAVKIR